MSLRHGLLGLLAEGPASGYDLTRRFEQVLGAVWPAGHPQIYGELSRLAGDGLIEIDSEGPRGRKAYRITDSGLDEIRRWLREPSEVDHTMRLQSLLRSFFFWLMEPADLNQHLVREAEFFASAAGRYRAYAQATDRGDFPDTPQNRSLRLAIEGGARLYEALAGWARWAAERSEAAGGRPRP
ncbi:PadR family transcriptional regulator [Frankia sp. Mgl5]|uniref:helix-turn-helix transcriptional regulator n=1 Tax=Frankiaceae TaxID=74712 RepID=UPI000054273F|nr:MULTISPECIES: helix-turn-helix transcriptional regulator [Frankiaceae]ABW10532.1 transcriptional regulator, PadR-like family [Frankia sp. EAN1pec]MCK9930517.1 PadR family transcriptional regulator [Frankia sp. Mgl5]CAI7978753.1 PadR family transcriptional regulator, regulatory protein AphA [Frankia sp. Hr75.2]SQD98873.1 Transcriptional regulator, PadR family [Parafrankia sp. Ea1.12]